MIGLLFSYHSHSPEDSIYLPFLSRKTEEITNNSSKFHRDDTRVININLQPEFRLNEFLCLLYQALLKYPKIVVDLEGRNSNRMFGYIDRRYLIQLTTIPELSDT